MHFCAFAYSTQRPNRNAEESSPFLDMASSFLENLSQGQGGGGGGLDGIAGIASVIGNMMQSSEGGKAQPSGAAQVIAGLGSLLAANAGGGGGNAGGGFDPSMIVNVIQMFAAVNSGGGDQRSKRSSEGSGMEMVLSLASTFLSNYNNNNEEREDDLETNEIKQNPYKKEEPKHPGDNLMNLLPLIVQTLSSFSGSDMEKTQQKHSHDHGTVLPPFLEKIHTAWDHFANSELSDAIYKKIGLDNVFKGFVGRDGKVDYDKLFESLQNQSFRKRWIQKAIVYLAEWANYLSQPDVYRR